MMKSLLYISLIFFSALSSCTTMRDRATYAHIKGDKTAVPRVVDTIPDIQIFELNMKFKDDEFSGLLLMKKLGEEHYRFVLTSHFGLTVFDMEVNKRDYKVHYCIQALNRERALYLLRNDFSMLLNPQFFTNIRYRISENKLTSLERSGSITKTVISFSDYNGNWPENLKIEHPYLKLFITLTKLPDDIARPV